MTSTWWSKQAGQTGSGATSTSTASAFSNLFATSKPTATPPPQQTIPVISSDTVLKLLKKFHLEGTDDRLETSMVFAKIGDEIMGGDDAQHVGLRWFRAVEGGKFEELHITKPFYQPSVDDVGNRLCVQCYDLKDESSSRFAEYGPIKLDPKIDEALSSPNIKVKARITGNEDIEIARSGFPPHHVVILKAYDGSIIEELIPSWRILANEAKRVLLGDGRELEFSSNFDRDVATLLVRTNPEKSKSVAPPSEDAAQSGSQSDFRLVEKQLKEKIMELEAQLMAEKARGGAAETGKALAEAQALKRELTKAQQEITGLSKELATVKKTKADLEERMRTLERENALTALKAEKHQGLQTELERAKEELIKAQASAKAAREQAEKTERALDDYDRSIPDLEGRAKRAEEVVAELETKLAKAQADTERAIGRKNAAQQKADSLAKDLARMLRATPGGLEEVEATMRENASLKQAVEDLRTELKQTRAAYESQLAASKAQAAKASAPVSIIGGASKESIKSSQLETLANSLMIEVRSKEEIIDSQREEIDRLNQRLQELQRRGKEHPGESA